MEVTRESTTLSNACSQSDLTLSSVSVSAIEGEPAIVINGAPPASMLFEYDYSIDLPTADEEATNYSPKVVNVKRAKDLKRAGKTGMLPSNLKGWKVKKRFGRKIYRGEVRSFDPETRWYHVIYEDGDEEDLEWVELEEILILPEADAKINAHTKFKK